MSNSPYEISKDEAMYYYAGVSPNPPKLVYRTGGEKWPWSLPTGAEDYRRFKDARGVFGHKLSLIWDDSISWTSIDVVRFITDGDKKEDEKTRGPVVIWVGVSPDSLESDDAENSSNKILSLLAISDVNDVEVEYRESVYRPSVGPALLSSVSNLITTVDFHGALTADLSLSIAVSDRPDHQGTMGLYFAEGGSSNKVLGLTSRHVLFETAEETNKDYVFAAGAPRKNVQLLSTSVFDKLLNSINMRVRRHRLMIIIYERQIDRWDAEAKAMTAGDNEEAETKALEETRELLKTTHQAIEDLDKFYDTVKSEWGPPEQRTIGHIRSSPAVTLNASPGGFTEDWGAFELEGSKFKNAFKGNFLDLGTIWIQPDKFTEKMCPRDDGQPTFKYPSDRLLALHDMIPEEHMREPDTLDQDKETCLIVIKDGSATGVTIGRATGMFSFVRADLSSQGSKEWAIYNYNYKSLVFSGPGDSGSIIVDGLGRIGGLLTGSAGKKDSPDVTYATPMWWLWPRIKQRFPDADLYPTTMA
ncbi:hypothetical protein B0H34DRAFT_749405 [Crassisporium funariophilum]|nr:hypothetical protein B0H34DRAFT_749405 [Crassisporium funariophilum]